jgi:hypothetical protein
VEPCSNIVANFSNLATLWKAARAGVDDAMYAGVPRLQVVQIDDEWNLTLQKRKAYFHVFIRYFLLRAQSLGAESGAVMISLFLL